MLMTVPYLLYVRLEVFLDSARSAIEIIDAGFFLLFGTLWAALEVQIEGDSGWAAKLPTTKFFGTHFTWYHVIMNAMVFVLTFKVVALSWALPFWIAGLFLIEDYMWFMINPGFGFVKYDSIHVTWHKWFWGMPIGNWISAIIMLGTATISYFTEDDSQLFVMSAVVSSYLLAATIMNTLISKPASAKAGMLIPPENTASQNILF